MSLYEVSEQYRNAIEKLFEYDSVTGELISLNAAELSQIQDNFEDKAISVASYIKNLEALSRDIDYAILGMKVRKNNVDMKIERLKDYLITSLEKCNVTNIKKSPLFEISIKKNPPSMIILDPSKIPSSYLRTETVTIRDNSLIKSDLKEGKRVPGAVLESRTRIDIK